MGYKTNLSRYLFLKYYLLIFHRALKNILEIFVFSMETRWITGSMKCMKKLEYRKKKKQESWQICITVTLLYFIPPYFINVILAFFFYQSQDNQLEKRFINTTFLSKFFSPPLKKNMKIRSI